MSEIVSVRIFVHSNGNSITIPALPVLRRFTRMSTLLSGIKPTLLMGPGPSCVPDEVYKALALPTLGHLDPYFIRIMDEIKGKLQQVMQTRNNVTLPMSGTGSAGMETCFVNLVEPGDRVLVCLNGVFSSRMQDVAERVGAKVDVLNFEWGTPVLVDKVAEQLKQGPYKIVAMVHAETSTGVLNPVQAVGELVKKSGALFLVDCVTSLGAIPVEMDAWGIDALYSCTQKGLACPPGLAPVSFSQKAVDALKARKTKVSSWYLDLSLLVSYWEGNKRAYHHTAPINMLYALDAGLDLILNEGLPAVFKRHMDVHQYLVQGLEKMGLPMFVAPEARLPQINAVTVPAGVDEAAVRDKLIKQYDIEIGAGLGPLAGKIWRIGTMGHTARRENVDTLLKAMKTCL